MATSAALDRTNLYTQPFWNIFNLLNTRSNVPDPRDASGKRKLFYAHEPDVRARNFEGYPVVVVNPASINTSGVRLGDDKTAEVSGELVVEVRSSDSFFRQPTALENQGKGLSYLDNLSDDIMETLNGVTNRNTLRANNIGMVRVEGGSVDFVDTEAERIYVRDFRVTFRTALLAVSS